MGSEATAYELAYTATLIAARHADRCALSEPYKTGELQLAARPFCVRKHVYLWMAETKKEQGMGKPAL